MDSDERYGALDSSAIICRKPPHRKEHEIGNEQEVSRNLIIIKFMNGDHM